MKLSTRTALAALLCLAFGATAQSYPAKPVRIIVGGPLDAIAAAGLLVGPEGKRFTDEGLGGVCMSNALAQLDDPMSAWVIYDEAMWGGEPGRKGPVAVNPHLVSAGGWMHSTPDLDALAAKTGLPAAALAATLREYNEALGHNRIERLAPARTTAKFKPLPSRRLPGCRRHAELV